MPWRTVELEPDPGPDGAGLGAVGGKVRGILTAGRRFARVSGSHCVTADSARSETGPARVFRRPTSDTGLPPRAFTAARGGGGGCAEKPPRRPVSTRARVLRRIASQRTYLGGDGPGWASYRLPVIRASSRSILARSSSRSSRRWAISPLARVSTSLSLLAEWLWVRGPRAFRAATDSGAPFVAALLGATYLLSASICVDGHSTLGHFPVSNCRAGFSFAWLPAAGPMPCVASFPRPTVPGAASSPARFCGRMWPVGPGSRAYLYPNLWDGNCSAWATSAWATLYSSRYRRCQLRSVERGGLKSWHSWASLSAALRVFPSAWTTARSPRAISARVHRRFLVGPSWAIQSPS